MRGAPDPLAMGHSPRIPFLTAFAIAFWRFQVHFCCSFQFLGGDSVSDHAYFAGQATETGAPLSIDVETKCRPSLIGE